MKWNRLDGIHCSPKLIKDVFMCLFAYKIGWITVATLGLLILSLFSQWNEVVQSGFAKKLNVCLQSVQGHIYSTEACFLFLGLSRLIQDQKLALCCKNNGKLLFILLFTNHTDDYWPKVRKKCANVLEEMMMNWAFYHFYDSKVVVSRSSSRHPAPAASPLKPTNERP